MEANGGFCSFITNMSENVSQARLFLEKEKDSEINLKSLELLKEVTSFAGILDEIEEKVIEIGNKYEVGIKKNDNENISGAEMLVSKLNNISIITIELEKKLDVKIPMIFWKETIKENAEQILKIILLLSDKNIEVKMYIDFLKDRLSFGKKQEIIKALENL